MKYTKAFYFRLSETDKQRLADNAQKFELSQSDYLRLLTQLPVVAPDDSATGIVLDTVTMLRISRELTKWGYHYNQGIHALNALLYRLRREPVEDDEIIKYLSDARQRLSEVKAGQVQIVQSLADLTDSTFLFN